MSPRIVRLVRIGPDLPDGELVDWLGGALPRWLAVATVREVDLPAPVPPDPSGRVSSNDLVDALMDLHPPDGDRAPDDWLLGLTALPLRSPEWPRVFGEAAVGGAWAVVSTADLEPADALLDQELWRQRVLREALHELGHVAGLPHCARDRCVMFPSIEPEQIERKGPGFCAPCRAAIGSLDPDSASR